MIKRILLRNKHESLLKERKLENLRKRLLQMRICSQLVTIAVLRNRSSSSRVKSEPQVGIKKNWIGKSINLLCPVSKSKNVEKIIACDPLKPIPTEVGKKMMRIGFLDFIGRRTLDRIKSAV